MDAHYAQARLWLIALGLWGFGTHIEQQSYCPNCVTRVAQSVWLLFIKDCYRPRLSPWMLLVQCVLFFILFANFFRQAYGKKKGSRGPASQARKDL